MKKAILVILLACIFGMGALSLWGSLRAKEAYRTLILAISESPNTRLLETSYEEGWLQSRAQASVEISGTAGEAFQQWLVGLGRDEVRGRVGIRMDQTIEHGYTPFLDWLTGGMEGTPVVGRIETRLELDQETQSELAAVMSRLPGVSISTKIRASGIGESTVDVPAQRLESKLAGDEGGGWQARWEGLQGNVVYTTDFGHIAASFRTAGIEGGSAESVFALRDLQWTADLTRDESGLMVGDVGTSVGSFRLASREEGGPRFELDRWRMHQSNAVQAGSFDGALEVRIQAIRVGDQAFGPGSVELQLENLDARSLARLQNQGVPGLAPPDSQGVTRTVVDGGAASPLFDLVSRSPRLELRTLHLATPSGDLEAWMSIDLDGSRPELLQDLFSLPLLFEVSAEIGCPAQILDALYRDREEELLELRSDGWVLLDGERYKSRLEFEQGELMVNGLPKSLAELMGQPEEAPAEIPQISLAD
jgi:uncharacterized protein YdgA (DUF945 family)